MEKYSKHLEVLVAERTQDLMHEKQRTDRLLYSTRHISTYLFITPVTGVNTATQTFYMLIIYNVIV